MKEVIKLFSPNTLKYFCPGLLALLSLSSLSPNVIDDLHPEKEGDDGESSDLKELTMKKERGKQVLTTLSQVALSTTGGQQKS